MTLADLLNTLESADMLRIIKGGEEMFVGYLALFAQEVGHTNCTLYEQHKNDTVVKFRAVPEITHRKWKELNLCHQDLQDIPFHLAFHIKSLSFAASVI